MNSSVKLNLALWVICAVGVFEAGPCAFGQAPPNDLFANRIVISGANGSVTGSNRNATVESWEPEVWPYIGGASAWWSWEAPSNGTVTFDTLGSSFNTSLLVYAGSSVSNLVRWAADDDPAGRGASQVSFFAVAGSVYQISVDGLLGETGDIVLNYWQGGTPPRLFAQPQSIIVALGDTAQFATTATVGTGAWAYQWFKDGAALAGATNYTLTLPNAQMADIGTYSVLLSNAVGTATSSNATLTVVALLLSGQPQDLIVATGYDATLSVVASGPGPIAYQWQKDGSAVAGATGSSLSLTNVAWSDGGIYRVAVDNGLTNITSAEANLSVIAPYRFVTLAGEAGVSGTNDGVGSAARFSGPHGICVDSAGCVYVTEAVNSTIREITPGGTVTTLAGTPGFSGTNDGPGAIARFKQPLGIALDGSGNLLVADTVNDTIRKMTPDGLVMTVAGVPRASGFRDAPAAIARFNQPADVAVDLDGNIYVADQYNSLLRKIATDGMVTTIAGVPTIGSGFFRDGLAPRAQFNRPCSVSIGPTGTLYIADEYNHVVRKLGADQSVTTLAGHPRVAGFSDGTGQGAGFYNPHGAKPDAVGNLYIADYENDTVRRLTPAGNVTTLAGVARSQGTVDGVGREARFSQPRGVVADRWGNLYVTDYNNHTVRKGWPADAAVPPVITQQPANQWLPAGSKLALSVGAGGTGLFAYQWYLGNASLAGRTNDTLVIASAQPSDSGIYSVVVSNAFGSVQSTAAQVTVVSPPVLQPPELLAGGGIRLLFRPADGAAPGDTTGFELEWRPTLPHAGDTEWFAITNGFYLTNGFVAIEDTNTFSEASRFYRVAQKPSP